MFRDAYDPAVAGVTLHKFFLMAESSQLFSDCLQLPIYTGAMRSTTMSKRELSQLASLVHSKFRLLELDLTPWLDVLPDGWGARLVSLRQGVRQELQQVGSGFDLDGRRALVAYRRYLMFLLWMRMVRREDLGEVGGPLAVRYVSCELDSLETIIRKDAGAFLAGPEEIRRLRITLGHKMSQRLLNGQPLMDAADGKERVKEDPAAAAAATARGNATARDAGAGAGAPAEAGASGAGDGAGAAPSTNSGPGAAAIVKREEPKATAKLSYGYLITENLGQACAGDPRVLGLTTRHAIKHASYVRSLAATRIQRAFRAHSLPPVGVPFLMRRYMHRKHSPFTGSLRQSMIDVVALAAAAVGNSVTDAPPSTVKRGWFANARHIPAESSETVAQELSLVLHTMTQIYIHKLKADKEDDKSSRSHLPLVELVYDLHLTLFGVREVAEKELHAFFVSVRKFAPKHPRVRTFALFCGIPMTVAASTKGGFFNLDVHLAVTAPKKPEAPAPPPVPDTVMPGTVESLYKVAAPPKAPLDELEDSLARAGEGGSDGLDTSSLATSMDREREAAIEREMVSTDAVQFYLKLVLALAEDAARPNAPEGGPSATVKPTGALMLFPTVLRPDTASAKTAATSTLRSSSYLGVDPSFVRLPHAVLVTRLALSALSDASADRVLRRYDSFEVGGLIDMDMVLRLCIEEWAAEAYKRGRNLASLFYVGDVDSNGVLSLDEFLAVIRQVRPVGFEAESVRMFREACVLTEDRNRKRLMGALSLGNGSEEAEIDVTSFLEVSRKFGLSTVKLSGGRDFHDIRDPVAMGQLLTSMWALYSEAVAQDAAKEVPPDQLDAMASHAKLQSRLSKFTSMLGHINAAVSSGGSVPDSEVDSAWVAFRLLLQDVGHFRQTLAEAETRSRLSLTAGDED